MAPSNTSTAATTSANHSLKPKRSSHTSSNSTTRQLEQSLIDNLPIHCSANKRVENPRFQTMSGRGRTRREEIEGQQLDQEDDDDQDLEEDQDELQNEQGIEDEEEVEDDEELEDDDEDEGSSKKRRTGKRVTIGTTFKGKEREKNLNKRNSGSVGRRKISMSYIEEKARRTVTFTKRKSGLMKKAFELSTLTGTDCLVVVVSESGLVYTFATPTLKGVTESERGKEVISLALKGELPVDLDQPTTSTNSLGTKKGSKPKSKSGQKERERSGSVQTLPTFQQQQPQQQQQQFQQEDLYVGMIDPALASTVDHFDFRAPSATAPTRSPFELPNPTSTAPSFPFSQTSPSPNLATIHPVRDLPDLGLPYPPHSSTSFSHSHSQELPIPPMSIPLPLPHDTSPYQPDQFPFFFAPRHSTASPTDAGESAGHAHDSHSLPVDPIAAPSTSAPGTSTLPTYDSNPVPLPSITTTTTTTAHSMTDPPSATNSTAVTNEGAEPERTEETPFERAKRTHQAAFEMYQKHATKFGNKNPTRSSTTTRESQGNGTNSHRGDEDVRREVCREVQDDSDREAVETNGGEYKRQKKLGANDFGQAAREWQRRITDRAAIVARTSSDGRGTVEESNSPNEEAEHSSGPRSHGCSVEERRRFWRDKSRQSILNAKKSPTITKFLHAKFLHTLSTMTVPPSLPRPASGTTASAGSSEDEIEGLPPPDAAALTLGQFGQFVSLNRLDLETGDTLVGVVDWFLACSASIDTEGGEQDQMAGSVRTVARSRNKTDPVKRHLIEWFDFLEGNELISEKVYLELIGLGPGKEGRDSAGQRLRDKLGR
ncbi:uncharacterized protein JCM15063_006286 [Sporobolomyces koalae]|uniref:uncharacterized protein n=1 Tax=Sporobolomyces koalae TaxID=500713 RepID=UPI00317B0D3E